jgi:hypothetical protein
MPDCSICCEKLNKSSRSPINCKTCISNETIVCQTCAKRYILDQPNDASCMVCKVEWDREFLAENFTKTFISKELKVHRENYLMDKQIAMLPATQEFAEQLKMIDGFEKQRLILMEKKKVLEKQIKKILKDVRTIDMEINDLRREAYNGNNTQAQDSKPKFTYKCPVENCNGFLNSSYNCGICENDICRHCMEIKEEEHTCEEEKKETVKLLNKDTKPCPKCGQLIFRSGGCEQMYCITCHTAFSWRTGQIERGHVHNPEYYRWMRENGRDIPRDPNDIAYDPCGNNVPEYTEVLRVIRIWFPATNNPDRVFQREHYRNYYGREIYQDQVETVKLSNMHRMIGHITHINERYNTELRHQDGELRNMRAHFILNKITREDFKKKLQMMEKKNEKSKKMNDIWNVLRFVLIEIVGRIMEIDINQVNRRQEIVDIINEAEKSRRYCNRSFEKVGKLFGMVYPGINKEWIQIHNMEQYLIDLRKAEERNRQRRNQEA